MSDTQEQIKDIRVNLLNVKKENIHPESRFIEDLGSDSLDAVEIVMAVEEKFGVEIDDEAHDDVKTVADITKYVEQRI